ncbi:hypothetical protein KC355_g4300 [Hortaea werneckii]|nr:hypothetical protein KC355_g4300 [Hortaea werneckii]
MAPGIIDPQPAVPQERQATLASMTESYDDTLRFYLNGTKVVLDTADPEVTLLEYLRGIGLTGEDRKGEWIPVRLLYTWDRYELVCSTTQQ